jgi:phytoene dehydrogenase-like protein
MLAQEALDPKEPTGGPGEALRRLVTDGAIRSESLSRSSSPAQGFLRRGAVNQPHRRDADRQPDDALAQPFALHQMSRLLTAAYPPPRLKALIAYYSAIVTSVGMDSGFARTGLLTAANFD